MPARKRPVRRKKPRTKRRVTKKTTKKATKRVSKKRNYVWPVMVGVGLLCVIGVLAYITYLDKQVRGQFEGRRWALPARVFARPLELYTGKRLDADTFVEELKLLHYQSDSSVASAGEYHRENNRVVLRTRGFPFLNGDEPERRVRIKFNQHGIASMTGLDNAEKMDLMRLEPVPIANIYPHHNEDRILVRLEDVPPLLIRFLITVEDRKFYDHHGIDFLAIGRALLANIKAGRTVQGGSTLTQQLVKNFFLTNERSLGRKLNEAVMALLLEWHYTKDEILEAYFNEVYLGQDRKRAIHGFSLASQFYFAKRLGDLKTEQLALLVALVKGPSVYEPRKHPERAKKRRDLVLDMLAQQQGTQGMIKAKQLKARSLGVTSKAPSGKTPFPAFLQLVRRQLQEYYQEEDLRSEGLIIFSTLDPIIQLHTERALKKRLVNLENKQNLPIGTLESAVVVTESESGEIQALVGGRRTALAGFNRALDARRSIGSLIKPVVYLTALTQPGHFTLMTRVDDSPLALEQANGESWKPRNYDGASHGRVMLRDALTHSYNISTTRLGLQIGVDKVARKLRDLGFKRSLPRNPSMLLGAVDLSPFEVTQVYQSLAAGGYRAPLSAIRGVMDQNGVLLQSYPLKIRKVADPAAVYLVNSVLHEVTRQGTARKLSYLLPDDIHVAGKTGTTNALRDSWFAGFTGERLAVVWVGRDNNQAAGLTGSSGAMMIWADIMKTIQVQSLNLKPPEDVEWKFVKTESGLLADASCRGADLMPFIKGTAPTTRAPCMSSTRNTTSPPMDWLKKIFN